MLSLRRRVQTVCACMNAHGGWGICIFIAKWSFFKKKKAEICLRWGQWLAGYVAVDEQFVFLCKKTNQSIWLCNIS